MDLIMCREGKMMNLWKEFGSGSGWHKREMKAKDFIDKYSEGWSKRGGCLRQDEIKGGRVPNAQLEVTYSKTFVNLDSSERFLKWMMYWGYIAWHLLVIYRNNLIQITKSRDGKIIWKPSSFVHRAREDMFVFLNWNCESYLSFLWCSEIAFSSSSVWLGTKRNSET